MSQDHIDCPQCGNELAAEAKFCRFCGFDMSGAEPEAVEPEPEQEEALSCNACGAELEADDKFCRQCGTPVGAAPEQKEAPPAKPEPKTDDVDDEDDEDDESLDEEVPESRPKKRRPKSARPRPRRRAPRADDDDRPEPRRRRKGRKDNNNRTLLMVGGFLLVAVVVVVIAQGGGNQQTSRPISPGTPIEGGAPGNTGGGGFAEGSNGSDPSDITGTLTFSPDMLKQVEATGPMRIFIIARPQDQPTGPPLAVSIAVMQSTAKPVPYSIGPADLMMGTGDFSQPVNISVTWDRDGNASTKEPLDVVGGPAKNPVKPGTKGVDLVLSEFRSELAAPAPSEPGAGAESAPAEAPSSAPAEGQGGAAPAAGEATGGISGKITVSPELAGALPNGGFFFVIARPAGQSAGPPLAVAKIPSAPPPAQYRLGPEHVMAGGDFNQPMNITIRWDQDGTANTQPGDISGALASPAKPGDTGADVILNKKH